MKLSCSKCNTKEDIEKFDEATLSKFGYGSYATSATEALATMELGLAEFMIVCPHCGDKDCSPRQAEIS